MHAQGRICGTILSRHPFVQYEDLVEVAKNGACCFVVECDMGQSNHVDRIMDWAHEHLPLIKKIAHAAGVLGYGSIQDMEASQFWQVAMPKVRRSVLDLCIVMCSLR